jgi:hypothetical protein
MEQLNILLLIAYLFVTSYFFINWLKFFNRSPSLSIEDRFLSVVILIIATLLWPFVVPISFIDELLKARGIRPGNKI